MDVKQIYTVEDMQLYVEGCLNDYENGISTKEETLIYLRDYTFRIIEVCSGKAELKDRQLTIPDVSGLCCPKGCKGLTYTHDDINNRSCCECGETWAI